MEAGEEFDCSECGRHLIVFPYDITKMRLCGACLIIPGWWTIPEIAKAIDPEHSRTVDDDRR